MTMVVFPTPVGVFPWQAGVLGRSLRLPHARGGVSAPDFPVKKSLSSSPRPWGCFPYDLLAAEGFGSSPRPWGCFLPHLLRHEPHGVFPTPVGVFPKPHSVRVFRVRLPHARGGVSDASRARAPHTPSSPRPWGCFQKRKQKTVGGPVFPTPVGVFPNSPSASAPFGSLPHARGGVSAGRSGCPCGKRSSPRPWGCFHPLGARDGLWRVFPTPVGVFPW